ncbi:integrase core domain-containing protein [Micromonospora sp. NPDC050200]|uniref:integrase core domain-containing protein n=1 Tax=Micromonospora sp. NPDC050200 TaxID=3155664 RepID=UPI0033C1935E
MSHTFALLRLLPASDREKDVEILALRHQVDVLRRQLDGQRVQLMPTDRALMAALLHPLQRQTLRQLRLLVCADTVLRWHRDLLARRHAARSRPRLSFLGTGDPHGTPRPAALFDTILSDAGIEVILTAVRMTHMNAIMERWVQTCRRELLDRTLIWSQHHLLHALHEFERHYNQHRPHQGIANTRPLRPLPTPITEPGRVEPGRPPTRPPRRHPARVPTRRVTCADEFRQAQALVDLTVEGRGRPPFDSFPRRPVD